MDDAQHALRAAAKLPATLAYWGADLRCRYANPAYSTWFGVDPRALIGRSIRDLLGDELYALNEPHILAVLAGQAQTFERIVPGPDGVNRQSLVNYIPDVVDGEVVGFVAHVTEVTLLKDRQAALQRVIDSLEAEVEQHRKAELMLSSDQQRLQESVAQGAGRAAQFENALRDVTAILDALKESVVDHIAVLDHQGTVTATNSTWREFAELWGSEAFGSVPRSAVGSNYLAECRALVGPSSGEAAQAAEGIAAVLAGREDLFTLEYKCHIPGDERWFLMSATRLQTSGTGAVIAHVDVTPGRMRHVRQDAAGAAAKRRQ